MRTIRTAVIGAGFMGSSHIEALKRIGGIDIVMIACDDESQAKNLANRYSIPKISTDWRGAIDNEEVEVIHNCTPNVLHFDINKAAILAGKHVISEKPLTINSDQSMELVKLAQEKGLVNVVNFNYRFYPIIQHTQGMLEQGEVGKIYLIHGHYLQDWLYYATDYNWRLETEISGDSRAMADIGSHWCDLVQFITGLKIRKVFADLVTIHKTRKRPACAVETFKGKEQTELTDAREISIRTEDAGSVLIEFDDGVKGVFTVSQISAGRKNRLWFEINGSKKSIAWDQEEPNKLWIGYREKANEELMKDPSLLSKDSRKYAHYPGGHPEGYPDGPKNLFTNVYDFIRTLKDQRVENTDFPTFSDGLWANRVVDAILMSHKEQKWIEL